MRLILEAICLDSKDVPPVMIKVPDDSGYDTVERKIVESLLRLPGEENEDPKIMEVGWFPHFRFLHQGSFHAQDDGLNSMLMRHLNCLLLCSYRCGTAAPPWINVHATSMAHPNPSCTG